MTLEEAKGFMKEVRWGCLATSDGQTVGCRPMGGRAWMGGELWCAAGAESDKIAQLRNVPHAEYCFARPSGEHIRIAGPCKVSTDNVDKRKLYDAVPFLKNHIPDPASPGYVVIRMAPSRIRAMRGDLDYEDVKLK
ncbi:MAG TPA: pyridoxamine 5'-phosphate oxidase family protein [Planctomycetota bacterium]|nr:pyridoxamine 5'-phosphate oxidase family protein [Planctomycetota bacterium]HRR80860.1 pyridoxamine 5'-phosphate oxidase family protein [Planctomycetota bacterium]HRT97160.1 pyridoxamine 5'-phosphate oxidase family protein [Planctomycetota bacterium]